MTIAQLLATDVALDKLAARGISAHHVQALPRNVHVVVGNPRGGGDLGARRLLVGLTDGGQSLTIVIEGTVDPTTWLIVTGWTSTAVERSLLGRR